MKTLMKSLAVAASVAAASLGTTAVNAATPITLTDDGAGGFSSDFSSKETGAINTSYDVTVPVSGAAEISFSIVKGYVTSAFFNGTEFSYTAQRGAGQYRSGLLDIASLAAGTYTLSFKGQGGPGGVLSGNIGLTPAVPEPASWALMIGGVGIVGGAMRRRQRTTVSFA